MSYRLNKADSHGVKATLKATPREKVPRYSVPSVFTGHLHNGARHTTAPRRRLFLRSHLMHAEQSENEMADGSMWIPELITHLVHLSQRALLATLNESTI